MPAAMRMARRGVLALLPSLVLWLAAAAWAGEAAHAGLNDPPGSDAASLTGSLPDAPHAQPPAKTPGPCQVKKMGTAAATGVTAVTGAASAAGGAPAEISTEPASPLQRAEAVICPPLMPVINWYARFIDGPQAKRMTPSQKAWLAVRNVADPFNALTILGSSAIAVGSDSHSPYGPGMTGFGKYVGVSYTQDMTGEFFGTFLIPSIAHQDPHYHRLPDATVKRRIAHCLYQVVWTQGDNGKGMVNYANVVGFAIDDEISNLYVPGRETNLPASAQRYATSFAAAPVDNFITEFLPDIASHIHVRVVLIQRIINQVAKTGSPTT